MPLNPEFLDYEPVSRSRNSKVFEEDGTSSWKETNLEFERTSRDKHPPSVTRPSVSSKKEKKNLLRFDILKRGHAVSFFGLLLFTAFVYLRPYELFPSLPFPESSAKWLALVTLIAFVPSQLGLEGNFTTRPREVNLVLLLALAALLSVPFAINPSEAWDNFTEFLKVVTMFIVFVNVVRTPGRLRSMLWIALGASVFMSITALADYRAGIFLTGNVRIKGVLGGLFDNPNDLALHLVTMVPLALGLMLCGRGLIRKLIYGICIFFMVAGIVVTFSRGGFLGLVAIAIVLVWRLGRQNRLMYSLIAVMLFIVFVVLAPGDYFGRVQSIFDSTLDPFGSSTSRQDVLKISIRVALRHPLLGIGMGNFHIVSNHELVSHNAYTQVAAELGMAALVFYTIFVVTPIKRLRQLERETFGVPEDKRFHYLAVGLQASLIGYMVTSFFASVAFLWYVYYLVGYAICISRIYANIIPDRTKSAEGDKVDALHSRWSAPST